MRFLKEGGLEIDRFSAGVSCQSCRNADAVLWIVAGRTEDFLHGGTQLVLCDECARILSGLIAKSVGKPYDNFNREESQRIDSV